MARTSKRVAREASRLLKKGHRRMVRSVAGAALRERRKPTKRYSRY